MQDQIGGYYPNFVEEDLLDPAACRGRFAFAGNEHHPQSEDIYSVQAPTS